MPTTTSAISRPDTELRPNRARAARALRVIRNANTPGARGGNLTLKIAGEIGVDTTASAIRAAIARANEPERICLEIDSEGGRVWEAMDIRRAIVESGATVTARVAGKCFSAAMIVYLAATKRQALSTARFLTHGSAMTVGRATARGLRLKVVALDQCDQAMAEVYAAATGNTESFCRRLLGAGDKRFNAFQAATLGFVDEVIMPNGRRRAPQVLEPRALMAGRLPISCAWLREQQ